MTLDGRRQGASSRPGEGILVSRRKTATPYRNLMELVKFPLATNWT